MKTLEEAHAEATKDYTAEQWNEHNREYEAAGHRIDLAQLFYDARTEAGLSQTALARLMRTSQSAIARIEAAGSSPSVELVERLAKATGKRLRMELEPA